MHTHINTYTHSYTHIHTYIHTYIPVLHTADARTHKNTFKATKDIAAGQELFYRYGSAQWFAQKNLPYADFNYASTKWRPDLQPLPCRQNVIQTIGADGRRSYAVRETVPSGAVLEISLCLEVPLVVVDQLPFFWDFVLTGETENEYNWLPMDWCLPARTHHPCFCRSR